MYFNTKISFGYVAPCDDLEPLCEVLTAEAVAWICISVRPLFSHCILTSLDLVGTQAMRHYLDEAHILSSSLPQEVAYDRGGDQEKARYT